MTAKQQNKHWRCSGRQSGALTSSAAYLIRAVNGASSGTENLQHASITMSYLRGDALTERATQQRKQREPRRKAYTLKGSLGSLVKVTLNVTLGGPDDALASIVPRYRAI